MDKTSLLFAVSAVKASKINEGSFNGELQKLKGRGAVKSPGRGQFQIGKVTGAASTSTHAAERKAKRTMSPEPESQRLRKHDGRRLRSREK